MPKIIEVPLSADSKIELAEVLHGITGLILNERIGAYNEGLDAGYDGAARCLESRLIMSDFPRDLETVRDGAAAIRALKDEFGRLP